MLKRFVRLFGGDPNKRAVDQFTQVVEEINGLEKSYEALSDEGLRAKTDEFRARLANGETLDDLLIEAFAIVREASKRTIGLRPFDVQLIGGMALHQGKIAEMRTGEGKTLVATLPLYLNALTGKGCHLVTVNDYLARLHARLMAPIYNGLGLSVGVLQMAARTENGKKAFLVDLERSSPQEDQHQLRLVARREAYAADITYGTNSEFGFDYLRDNMTMRLDERVQRPGAGEGAGLYFAIVDEVDNVLIDEARTPLIISGPAQDEGEAYVRMAQVVRQLRPEDYEVSERDRHVNLTEIGEAHVEDLLGAPLRDPDRPEDLTHEQARALGYLEQALTAQFLYSRNKDYLVQGGKVIIVDEFTGRMMPGRRWSNGLHQAVEAKEGQRVQAENVTYATVTIQNYYRMYEKLAGMTGTAATEAEEFDKIYKLDVVTIPTNLEYQASRPEANLSEVEQKDEQGYKYSCYVRPGDAEKTPVFWRRKDYPDVVYRTEEAKLRALTREILFYHAQGRPILVGTTSVELSERVSARLRADPLRRLGMILILRSAWFEANQRVEDGRQIAELQFLNAKMDELDLSAMRKLGRELNLSFNPEDAANLDRLTQLLSLNANDRPRLGDALQGGISHQVLNARKHTEESQIIAGAGAYGAVTIATNMAGRGVDIKLGGELAEEIITAVNRVLRRAGNADPYDMTMQERREALQTLPPADYGIYEAEIQYFLRHMDDMDKVRTLGGLHVIGSVRHEARRIDNQLRGRSARQGDPGSSRFYLSMEDDLMRLFGGGQADSLMQRLKIDDDIPLEMGLVGRIVEQSQTRVEGANFDVRKHLLEYDDVLNTQRGKIYAQRNRIFTKPDLSEDVAEMLRAEVNQRAPAALNDPDGPWKLLSWMEQVQPPLQFGNLIYPSYIQRLLLDHLRRGVSGELPPQTALERLLDVAEGSLKAEDEHLLHAADLLLLQAQEKLQAQLDERLEGIDAFFQSLQDEEGEPRSPRQLMDELNGLARLPLRLSPEQQRLLRSDPRQAHKMVEQQVENQLVAQAVSRLIVSVERRLGDDLGLDVNRLPGDWDALAEAVIGAVEASLLRRRERYLGKEGVIRRDLENALGKAAGALSANALLQLLIFIPQGSKAAFDKKTHRRVVQRTTRLTYIYFAAGLLENRPPEEVAAEALKHLEMAQQTMLQVWGSSEWSRLSNVSIAELSAGAQNGLSAALGEETFARVRLQPLNGLTPTENEIVIAELGRQALTGIYRQLLLQIITELWVDYLTQMEALRVSIGLEAYAQRDPLVQYKNRAFGLFQELLNNMRLGVVTRMFTYRPRDLSSVQTGLGRSEAAKAEELPLPEEVEEEGEAAEIEGAASAPEARNRKRRRRRH